MSEVFHYATPYDEQVSDSQTPEWFKDIRSRGDLPLGPEAFDDSADDLERVTALIGQTTLAFAERYDAAMPTEDIRSGRKLMVNGREYEADELTGAYTRAALHDIETMRNNTLTDAAEDVIVVFDIDDLKRANDLSYSGADRMLAKFAEVFRQSTRTDDVLVRYGGDEFVGVFRVDSAAAADQMSAILLRIMNDFQTSSFEELPDYVPGVTCGFEFTRAHATYADAINMAMAEVADQKKDRPRVVVDVSKLTAVQLSEYARNMQVALDAFDPADTVSVELLRERLLEELQKLKLTER